MLLGTPEGAKLSQYISEGRPGSIHPMAKASFFYETPKLARVDLAIALPFTGIMPTDWNGEMEPFALLIAACGRDGQIVARQSQSYLQNSSSRPSVRTDQILDLGPVAVNMTSVRYEGQMRLPPGEYKFKIAFTRGRDFGVSETPLKINAYDKSGLGISSLVLCKRVREPGAKPIAEDFVPLLTRTGEFTPAIDNVFHNGDSLMAYFELYEPTEIPPEQALHIGYTMRIRNEQTGMDVIRNVESADSWIQPGKSAIPIAIKPLLSKLNLVPGKYQFEIQGSDSAGRSTTQLTAEFWID